MGKARDQAGNIWETDAQGNAVRLIQPAPSNPMNNPMVDPRLQFQVQAAQGAAAAAPYVAPKAAAEAQAAQATAPYAAPKAQADVTNTQAATGKTTAETQRIIQQMRMGSIPEGMRLTADGKLEPIPVSTSPLEIKQKQTAESLLRAAGVDLKNNIDPIAALIRGSTSGRLQHAGAETYGAITGDTTTGMENIGRLKTVVSDMVLQLTGGGLGNQVSDADRQFIIERVGDLANPDVPAGQRLAAWQQVKQRMANILGVGGYDGGSVNQNVKSGGNGFNETPNADASTFLDSLVQQGVPYSQALASFNQRFPGFKGPNGESGFSPSQYQSAVEFARQNPGLGGHPSRAIERKPLSAAESANNTLAHTGPVAGIGHFADASVAGLPSALAGDQGQYFNQVSRNEHPYYSAAGDIGGAIAATYGLNRGLKAAPIDLLKKPGVRAATADTIFGGTYGATQNPDNRVAGAALGAGSMLTGNAVGQLAIGPGLAALGTTRPGRAVAGMFGANPVKALPAPEGIVAGQASKNASDIFGNLDEAASLNLPYSLADANPQLRVLAGSATRKAPEVRQLAEDTIGPRHAGQAERAISAIDTHLAQSGDINAIKGAEVEAARNSAAPLYEAAYAQPARTSDALEALLATPAGKQALSRARTIAANEQRDPLAMGFDLNDLGETVLTKKPSIQTIDYVKRGLDDILEQYRNPITRELRLDEAGRAIDSVRRNMLNEVDRLNPHYKAAREAYAREASKATDADRGYNSIGPRVTPDTVAGVLSGLKPDNVPLFQRGYASALADKVDNLGLASDPYKAIYGSPAQQAKIGTVFPQGAPRFARVNALENDMAKTNYETLGGSPTAARVSADNMFDGPGGMAADLAFTAASGTPTPRLIEKVGRGLTDFYRMGRGTKKAKELGPILLNTDPAESAAFLRQVLDLNAARKQYLARSRAAGGMFVAPLALPFIPNQ